jgi:hypothetical protein
MSLRWILLLLSLIALAQASSDTSSSSWSTTSDSDDDDSSASSSVVFRRRAATDRRIAEAVRDALLATPQKQGSPVLDDGISQSKSYQFHVTTTNLRIANDTADAIFGPLAVVSFTNPPNGLAGPLRTRTELLAQANTNGPNDFADLTRLARQAGFYSELVLRTIVETTADARVSITSPALLSPCFPVTDEEDLALELVIGIPQLSGLIWERFDAMTTFFDGEGAYVDNKYIDVYRRVFDTDLNAFVVVDEDEGPAASITIQSCSQFSYFA